MALLWQKQVKNTLYEVRTAGNTRRLYTDGVFHSQYNPNHPVTGGVWDILMLPALFYPAKTIQRVLVLGVGGGAAIHLLDRYVQPSHITGVELNPVHISVARRFFGIKPGMAKIIQADAITWLQNYQGPPFDMIIDDLFGEKDGEPYRVAKANKQWMSLLYQHLTVEGALVMNFISPADLKNSAALSYKKLSGMYSSIFQFTLSHYVNAVGAFLKKPATSQQLRKAIKQHKVLSAARKLDYHVKKLR